MTNFLLAIKLSLIGDTISTEKKDIKNFQENFYLKQHCHQKKKMTKFQVKNCSQKNDKISKK